MTDPYASEKETAALIKPDTRTPAEKRLYQLIEAESVPELCGSDYTEAIYKAAIKLAAKDLQNDPDHIDHATHIDMLKSWLLEAEVSGTALSKHLDNVIEIAETWQPDYATKMDLDTIRNAKERLTVQTQHSDDQAVDRFAAALKEKLAKAREKGRSGWETCPPEDLSQMLRDHVEKGDPRDVANFSMMLWNLSAGIAPQPSQPQQSCYCLNCEELSKELAALKKQPQIACCAECGKKDSDGWALYCVECMDKIHAILDPAEKKLDALIAQNTPTPSPKNHGDI